MTLSQMRWHIHRLRHVRNVLAKCHLGSMCQLCRGCIPAHEICKEIPTMDNGIPCQSNCYTAPATGSACIHQMCAHTYGIVHLHTAQLSSVLRFHRRPCSIERRPTHFVRLRERFAQRQQPAFVFYPFLCFLNTKKWK